MSKTKPLTTSSYGGSLGETILEVPEEVCFLKIEVFFIDFFSSFFFVYVCVCFQLTTSSLLDDYDDHGNEEYSGYGRDEHNTVIDDSEGDPEHDYEAADGYFSLLPDELVQVILKELPIRDYLLFSNTCTRLRNVCFYSEPLFHPQQ